MPEVISHEIFNKLGELGFEEEEINTFRKIHELKSRPYSVDIDINKLINQAAFENLSKGIGKTFDKNKWSNEDFFEIVENHRLPKS
jgi:hypothetical protein